MFLLFAVLPLFVVNELHGAKSQVGLIMGAFAISAVLTRPFSGRIVDLWSRKTGLRIGALIYWITPALYTFAATVPVMFALRFLHGIGIAIYTTAGSVYVADNAPAARRGEAMGYYGMAMNLSMAIGPALGVALIDHIGFHGLFWLASFLGLLSFVLVQFLHEPIRPHQQAEHPAGRPAIFSRIALFPGFIAMCMTMTFGTVVSFLPLFVQQHHLGNAGLFFVVYSIVVVVLRPISGRLSDRFGRATIIIPGMFFLAFSMLVLAYSVSMTGLLFAAVLQGIGFGAVHPSIMALVVDRSTMHDRGPALATVMMAFDIGVGFSAIGLGQVLEHTDFTTMYLCAAGIAMIGALAVTAVTFFQREEKSPALHS
ncbi:MAG: MFS transporter [Deltaproteobacteria bacterium]|nr:MFS transporter [Deltaproteobacteria bacterium]